MPMLMSLCMAVSVPMPMRAGTGARHLHELIDAPLALPPRPPPAPAAAPHDALRRAIRHVILPLASGGTLGLGVGDRVALGSEPPPRRGEAPRAQPPRLRPARVADDGEVLEPCRRVERLCTHAMHMPYT